MLMTGTDAEDARKIAWVLNEEIKSGKVQLQFDPYKKGWVGRTITVRPIHWGLQVIHENKIFFVPLKEFYKRLNTISKFHTYQARDDINIEGCCIVDLHKLDMSLLKIELLSLKSAEVLGEIGEASEDKMKEVTQASTESLEKLGHKIALLKWTLDIEKKNIELRIDTDQFILETPDCKIQFEICFSIAYQMLGQLRAVVTPPNIPKQSLGEEINGKTLIMGLVLGQNDHWIINLQYGNDNFYAELTLNDIYKIGTVLDRYLN